MRLRSLFRRRPTASMVISMISLFVALGGVGYAAVLLPANSVGTKQIKNNAVTYKKIAPHTVGLQRIDQTRVQVRVSGSCSNNSAINTVTLGGKVTCQSTLPDQFGASSDSTTVGTTSTTVVSKVLPAGNYLLNAIPYATIKPAVTAPANQHVLVTCTLSAASGSSQTRTVSVETGGTGAPTQQVAIPMTFPATVAAPQGTAHVDCIHASTPAAPAPAVTVQSTLNAIPTHSNN
jgi:hypothetical protein